MADRAISKDELTHRVHGMHVTKVSSNAGLELHLCPHQFVPAVLAAAASGGGDDTRVAIAEPVPPSRVAAILDAVNIVWLWPSLDASPTRTAVKPHSEPER